MESSLYPIPRTFCGAKTRNGGKCKQPAMPNGRCWLHGGKSLSGTSHGRYVHGQRTKEMMKLKQDLAKILKESKALLKGI